MLFRFKPFMVFNDDETAGVGTPPEAAAPEPVAPPAQQPGPWAADLAEYFGENSEAIAAADRYMREKVQPARTQLETEVAPARALWKDINSDPETTLRSIVAELWDDDKAAQFEALIAAEEAAAAAEPTPPEPTPDEPPAWAQPLLERDQAQRDADAIAEGERLYQEVLTDLRAAHPDLTDHDIEHIHPFMASADDPEAAYAGYQAYKTSLLGSQPAAPVATPEAPPVLGADGTVAAAPPIAKEYKTFDDAWDAWKAEEAVVAPPVVGSA